MRVDDKVLKSVVFIGVPASDEGDNPAMHPLGTAFHVLVPSKRRKNIGYGHLVTAKHVALERMTGDVALRGNEKDGGEFWARGPAAWVFHPSDDSADVAVMPWVFPDHMDYKAVPTEMFVTDEDIREGRVGVGDETFITGLFTRHTGSSRNEPIVRTGNIAMLPHDPVPTTMGLVDAYLVEARSLGGLSGSPVFVRQPVGGLFRLFGLMHGHWDIPLSERDDVALDDQTGATGGVNLGIAIVVPAKKILETLHHPKLVDMRDREDARAEP